MRVRPPCFWGFAHAKPHSEIARAEAIEGLFELDLEKEWPYGSRGELRDVAALLEDARALSLRDLDREFHHLFVGPQHLEAPPWGSVYLDAEAVVFGDSCKDLVRWMRRHGIALHEGASREPADQIGRMLVLLSWICRNDPSFWTSICSAISSHGRPRI